MAKINGHPCTPTPHRPPPFLTFWYRTSVSGGVAMTDVLLGAAALDFARLEGRIQFNAEISCKISAVMQYNSMEQLEQK